MSPLELYAKLCHLMFSITPHHLSLMTLFNLNSSSLKINSSNVANIDLNCLYVPSHPPPHFFVWLWVSHFSEYVGDLIFSENFFEYVLCTSLTTSCIPIEWHFMVSRYLLNLCEPIALFMNVLCRLDREYCRG
jgi:hypothetical protein